MTVSDLSDVAVFATLAVGAAAAAPAVFRAIPDRAPGHNPDQPLPRRGRRPREGARWTHAG